MSIQLADSRLLALFEAKIVAVLRAPSRVSLVPITEALLQGGITAIEVTTSTPDALKGIEDLREVYGDQILLGCGTVLDDQTARDAVSAGADFVVSPIFDPKIVEATLEVGALSIPGAFTPTEIYAAWKAGAHVVKVFPSTSLGPTYLKDILAPMPFLRLMPTGGVDAKSLAGWIGAGAFCVGAGSSLVRMDLIKAGHFGDLVYHAKMFRAAVHTLE